MDGVLKVNEVMVGPTLYIGGRHRYTSVIEIATNNQCVEAVVYIGAQVSAINKIFLII